MMYGRYPFEGKNIATLSVAISKKKIINPPPPEIEQNYSEELKNILSLLLSPVYLYVFYIYMM
jgi:hypothetical protein